MAFTYRPGSRTTLDRIRVRIGDTDQFASADLRLEDEEIADLVVTEGGFMRAAAATAEALAAKFARKAEGSQGGVRGPTASSPPTGRTTSGASRHSSAPRPGRVRAHGRRDLARERGEDA